VAQYDLPLEQLRQYLPERKEEPDFDDFWRETISESLGRFEPPVFEEVDSGLKLLKTYDVTVQRIHGSKDQGMVHRSEEFEG